VGRDGPCSISALELQQLLHNWVTWVFDQYCFTEILHLINYFYILILGVPEFGVSAS
jgi:hypothetical protein